MITTLIKLVLFILISFHIVAGNTLNDFIWSQLGCYLFFYIFFVTGRAGQYVTCGSAIKLQNLAYKIRLHSHDVKYGSGSGQQSVTGTDTTDDVNSHWAILGPLNKTCKRGYGINNIQVNVE